MWIRGSIIDRLEQRHNILRVNIRHDIVNMLKDKAASFLHNFNLFSHILSNFFRSLARQDIPGVATAAPEADADTTFLLQ